MVSLTESEDACTANSRMRCNIAVCCDIAPSAVCSKLIASLPFLAAMFRPRICEVIVSAMANPAASSLALLMREPVESCCIAEDRLRAFICSAFCANSEFILVLITDMI